jgi:hypothetical protein
MLIDYLKFTVHDRQDHNFNNFVTVRLSSAFGDCLIISSDEIWCEGKAQQILNFFSNPPTMVWKNIPKTSVSLYCATVGYINFYF